MEGGSGDLNKWKVESGKLTGDSGQLSFYTSNHFIMVILIFSKLHEKVINSDERSIILDIFKI